MSEQAEPESNEPVKDPLLNILAEVPNQAVQVATVAAQLIEVQRERDALAAKMAMHDQAIRDALAWQADNDPTHPLYHDGTAHWHVDRYAEDVDRYAAHTVYDVLHYAGEHLNLLGEIGLDLATTYAQHERYAAAWTEHVSGQEAFGLADNCDNLWKQATVSPWDRAPVYRDPATARERLMVAARSHVQRINEDGHHVRIWECADPECAPHDDEEDM